MFDNHEIIKIKDILERIQIDFKPCVFIIYLDQCDFSSLSI